MALIVLGMHRSGTSALTRVLSLCGYALPATLLQPADDNEEGFWESQPITEFNDELLKLVGSHWDDPFGFAPTRTSITGLMAHQDRAVRLIRSEFPEPGPLVLKDPRITVLYDFWRQALQAAGYEPTPVICVRHPLEVAASLAKRNKFPANKSLLIWLSYQLAGERATRGGPRAFTNYDDLMSDWRDCLDQIELSLGVPLERRDPQSEVLIERFLRPDMRHHSVDGRAGAGRNSPAWVNDAYAWFSAAARNGRPDVSGLDAAVAEYERQRKWFGPILADVRLDLEEVRAAAARQVQAIEARLLDADAAYRAEIEGRDWSAAAAAEANASRIAEVEAQVAEVERVRVAQLAERNDEIARQKANTARIDAELRAARARIAAGEAELQRGRAAHARIAELEAQVFQIESARSAEFERAEGATRLLQEARRDLAVNEAATARRLSEFEAQVSEIESARSAQLQHVEEARAAADRRISELEAQVFEIERIRLTQVAAFEHRLAEADTQRGEIAALDELLRAATSDRLIAAEKQAALDRQAALEREIQRAELSALDARLQSAASDRLRATEVQAALERRLAETSAAFEAERVRRENEIRAEIRQAEDVIAGLQSDLVRTQMVARDRLQQLERTLKDNHEITSSTLWKLMKPARWMGRKAPFLSKGVRGARSSLAAMVRGRRLADATPVAIAPTPASQSPSAITPSPRHAQPATDVKFVNPEPIAAYLRAESGESEFADAWREHCKQFPLPIDPDSQEKPKLELSDAQANEWIRRCAEAGAHLPVLNAAPGVSIIIPVYNQLAFTLSAIASVYALKSLHTYEILLADDGSTDQTRLLTDASLPRVRLVRHAKNLGFLLNCNVAAEQAKGAYIVLLNNDTVVLPGWLDELIGALKDDPRVGLVGSKLLYANGVLQEAGGIVWRDGSAWNWGRNQDPRDPRYCYAREVDYCSGASIAVPTDLWRQLGGFDGRTYENSYYEDVDMAFRIRAAGRKVMYQPLSAIVHFEGVSSGVDVSAGAKKYQVTNGERFFGRWREVLRSHRPNAVEPVLECERSIKGRLLIIDAVTPTPEHDAGSLVMMEMIKSFQDNGWRVTFLPEDNFAHLPTVTTRLQRRGIETLYWPHYKSVAEIFERRETEFDIVLISRVGPASKHLETVRRNAPHAKVIFNTVDLHYLREQREAALSQDPEAVRQAEKTKTLEVGIVAGSDLTIVHSTAERDLLAQEAPGARVAVFPWVSDVRRSSATLQTREGILFVGGFRHAPNVDGLRWFLQQVWPRVRAESPGASLKVIGADAPTEFDKYNGVDGVTMMGWVKNLEAQLDRVRVSIAPLRYGAGVKGKVVSALSNGVPVVCTTIASEGMGLRSGQDVIVCDEADEFARAVVRLLRDDAAWAHLSENGLRFVEANYSRDAAKKRVVSMIEAVGPVRAEQG